ncbi:unnamed protein product, partial [Microthlaspi erraticum]
LLMFIPKEILMMITCQLSLYLYVANPESLRLGWKRRASFSFVLLNESGKELFKKPEILFNFFNAEVTGWGYTKALPLKELKKKGLLEKKKIIVKVEVKVVEVIDGGHVTGKDTLDVSGFQVLYSQAIRVSKLFVKHPDMAVNFRLTNQLVRTTYINILLGLIETLEKPPHSISETELGNARSELNDLTQAGFKLEWLKTKIDEVSLKRKVSNAPNDTRVQELEEDIKNIKDELNKEKVKFLSLEQTVSDLRDEVWDFKDELNKKRKLNPQ